MKTRATEMFDLDFPLFAFSHCRDVVAAVTNAGGLGVFGVTNFSPEKLELELRWIDEQVNGKPYGIDIVMPAKYVGKDEVDPGDYRDEFLRMIADEQKSFAEGLLVKHLVPPADAVLDNIDVPKMSHEYAEELLQVALRHPASLLVNALGPMPEHVIERAHARGMKTAGLVGSVRHAEKQVELGVDLLVAQGTEAGGHCGDIATMVLVPDVVDAVDCPVVAAGGIGTGRQIAAALALGAEGAWTGSIWLTTAESDVSSVVLDNLLSASAHDTVRSRAMSGKPCRQLRTGWTEAWDDPAGPGPLATPLQGMIFMPAMERIERYGVRELAGSAVGQIVGRMSKVRPARQVFLDLISETIDAAEQLNSLIESDR
jgi:NAD(P)H-dependent flavin oxidoreductase YrpB (nitropropane dioxygenase family)